jgi:hypothetical protein
MDDKPARRERASGVALATVLVVVLFLLPFLYVLSIGPAAWLVHTGRLNDDEGSFAVRFYTPLIWAADTCQPVDYSIQWYVSFWEPQRSPQVVVSNLTPAPPLPVPVSLPAGS